MFRSMAVLTGLLASTGLALGNPNQFFTEFTKDFGTTPRGPILQHFFLVKNTTNQPITLGQPRVSCGCVSADVAGKTQLAPGETTHIRALMDTRRIPQANVVKTVIVYVPFIAPPLGEAQLQVKAIARDDLVLSPEYLAFGTVRKGEGGKASTRITLYTDPNWQITEAASTGAYVKATVKPLPRQGHEASFEVSATLDPACPVGNWTADIWLKTTNSGVDRLRIPVTVNVVSPIVVNPTTVAFGEVKVGSTNEQKVILQGTQPFQVKEIRGNAGDLKVSKIAEGSRPVHILRLALTPSAAGAITRSIEVETDSKEQPKVVVPITARAVND